MQSQPNLEFLRRAIALATENVVSGRGGPFAALIVRDGRIIAEGVNMVTATNDPTAHGEVTAIRAACKALNTFTLAGCELYTSCEPCPMCLAASHWARLDAVYFGAVRLMQLGPDSMMPICMRSSAKLHRSGPCQRRSSFAMRHGPVLRRGLLLQTNSNTDWRSRRISVDAEDNFRLLSAAKSFKAVANCPEPCMR